MLVPARAVALFTIVLVLSPVSALSTQSAPVDSLAEGFAMASGLPIADPAPREASLPDLIAQADARLGIVRAPGAYDALASLDPRLSDVLADLLSVQLFAAAERDAAFAGVSDAEIAALADDEGSPAAMAVLARVDGARLRSAAMQMARAVDLARPALLALAAERGALSSASALAPSPSAPALAPAPTIDLFPILGVDPLGVDNAFPHDYLLSVDLGGNDVYDNNAGGSILFGRGFIVGDPSTFGPSLPGGLVMGGEYEDAQESYTATLAIDAAGNDVYGVYKSPSTVGGSKDRLCTSGLLIRRIVTQGGGSGGIGMLADLGGNDQYRAKTLSQGHGHVQGVGILYDGAGDDAYTAIRSAQGASVLQGVGVMIDAQGNDLHQFVSPTGGIFNVDSGRCDAGTRNGLGTAVVQGGALFLDASGDDSYKITSAGLGHSDAMSAGTFIDARGIDNYNGYAGRANGIRLVEQAFAGAGVFVDAE